MDTGDFLKLERQIEALRSELAQTKLQLTAEQRRHIKAEAALKAEIGQIHGILDSIEAGVAFVDSKRCYRYVNRFYELRFNQTKNSLLGQHVRDVIGAKTYESVKHYIDQVLAGEPQSFDFDITYPNGEQAYINCSLTPARGPGEIVDGYYLFVFDITHRRVLEEALKFVNAELEELVTLDGLTHVANRRKLDEYLAEEWGRATRSQQPLSLIMLDIDFFKPYNDCYGHQAGDICLITVAQAVQSAVRRSTDLVARYGGEEFAVILPSTDLAGAEVIANEIRQAVTALEIPHQGSESSSIVSVSLGIACVVPTTASSSEELIAQADQALYLAKQQGRNCYVMNTNASAIRDK